MPHAAITTNVYIRLSARTVQLLAKNVTEEQESFIRRETSSQHQAFTDGLICTVVTIFVPTFAPTRLSWRSVRSPWPSQSFTTFLSTIVTRQSANSFSVMSPSATSLCSFVGS